MGVANFNIDFYVVKETLLAKFLLAEPSRVVSTASCPRLTGATFEGVGRFRSKILRRRAECVRWKPISKALTSEFVHEQIAMIGGFILAVACLALWGQGASLCFFPAEGARGRLVHCPSDWLIIFRAFRRVLSSSYSLLSFGSRRRRIVHFEGKGTYSPPPFPSPSPSPSFFQSR